ncbi:hypothetical protein A2V71_01235 [Candidatus Berkelbacteria bacterium RBG_13_40_8]|uniref:Quinate/shikimate 5-dehydrogenase/glutamyl-tRNA reductase domain-containing protein n=1 Tax=Candidatus Berkelbacteria bacterium RBG_13_40_8 TaxID=1797467 RepID=A0A1F5DMH5_9BACT|nr:MAG: hypothetical protein A2V71_01235 [Candidatus Berkelbacteria bacterium RBG_13_40_8]
MFLKGRTFSGGKAVATSFGALLVLMPIISLKSGGWFLATLFFFRYISLSSTVGAIAAFCYTFHYGLPLAWKITIGILLVAIIYKHKRNYLRIISGKEPRVRSLVDIIKKLIGVYEKTWPVVRVSILVHAITIEDAKQIWIARIFYWLYKKKVISEKFLKKIALLGRLLEDHHISGVQVPDGRRIESRLFGMTALAEQLMERVTKEEMEAKLAEEAERTGAPKKDLPAKLPFRHQAIIDDRLKAFAVLSAEFGANSGVLAALTSSVAPKGGLEIQQWITKEGLPLTITNGATATTAALIHALRQKRPNLDELIIAIVGGEGMIALGATVYLEQKYGKNPKPGFKIINVAHSKKIEPNSQIVLSTTDLSLIREASIVVLATSSPYPIIIPENAHYLAPGALVADVAVPVDFDDQILLIRPDIEMFRAGMMLAPGNYRSDVDLHFPYVGSFPLLPACFVEGMIIALEMVDQSRPHPLATASGRVYPDKVDEYLRLFEKYNFRVVISQVSEGAVFSGQGGTQ